MGRHSSGIWVKLGFILIFSFSALSSYANSCDSTLTATKLKTWEGRLLNTINAGKELVTRTHSLFNPKIKKSHIKYKHLSELVKDLESGALREQDLAGDIISIPPELGLRSTLTHGRMIRLKTTQGTRKGVKFFVSGLFYGGEKFLMQRDFINEQLAKGYDVIYLEVSQGFTAAKEIINNHKDSPSKIRHEEQQVLLAYYLMSAIKKYDIKPDMQKILMGHSYGGWLINRTMSNPEFNGKEPLKNPYLAQLGEQLYKEGYLDNNPMKGIIDIMVPLDGGLGSLHYAHPVFEQLIGLATSKVWSPLKTFNEISLGQLMRSALLEEFSTPERKATKHGDADAKTMGLDQDTHSLDNAVALFLGIQSETVTDAPRDIPKEIKIFDIVAGESDLIPSSWHRHHHDALMASSEGPNHRSTFIIKGAKHDMLPIKGLGRFIAQLNGNEHKFDKPVTVINLNYGKVYSRGYDEYPGSLRVDLFQLFMDMNLKALDKAIVTTQKNADKSMQFYQRLFSVVINKSDGSAEGFKPKTVEQAKQFWEKFIPPIWRKVLKPQHQSEN